MAQDIKCNGTKIVTTNPQWGFFGTVMTNYRVDEQTAANTFTLVVESLSKSLKIEQALVIKFLDSTHGRHLADAISFKMSQESGQSSGQLLQATLELFNDIINSDWRKSLRKFCSESV